MDVYLPIAPDEVYLNNRRQQRAEYEALFAAGAFVSPEGLALHEAKAREAEARQAERQAVG